MKKAKNQTGFVLDLPHFKSSLTLLSARQIVAIDRVSDTIVDIYFAKDFGPYQRCISETAKESEQVYNETTAAINNFLKANRRVAVAPKPTEQKSLIAELLKLPEIEKLRSSAGSVVHTFLESLVAAQAK